MGRSSPSYRTPTLDWAATACIKDNSQVHSKWGLVSDKATYPPFDGLSLDYENLKSLREVRKTVDTLDTAGCLGLCIWNGPVILYIVKSASEHCQCSSGLYRSQSQRSWGTRITLDGQLSRTETPQNNCHPRLKSEFTTPTSRKFYFREIKLKELPPSSSK